MVVIGGGGLFLMSVVPLYPRAKFMKHRILEERTQAPAVPTTSLDAPHRAAFNALTIGPLPARRAASTSVEKPSPFSGFFFYFITLGLELRDTKVYEP